MTFATYYPAIPNGPNNPSADQPLMKQNALSISNLIAIDHIGFNASNGGYHTNIHMPTQGSFPTVKSPIAGMIQLYSLLYTPNTSPGASPAHAQLYATNDGGTVQLTGTSTVQEGWAWVGGILLQWGQVTGKSGAWPTTPQPITFQSRSPSSTIPFTSNCFVVTTTFIGPTSSSTGDICINSKSNTQFIWQFTGSASASFDGFYWIAIGN